MSLFFGSINWRQVPKLSRMSHARKNSLHWAKPMDLVFSTLRCTLLTIFTGSDLEHVHVQSRTQRVRRHWITSTENAMFSTVSQFASNYSNWTDCRYYFVIPIPQRPHHPTQQKKIKIFPYCETEICVDVINSIWLELGLDPKLGYPAA